MSAPWWHPEASPLADIRALSLAAEQEYRVTRYGPSITDCIAAAMAADSLLTVEEAIRTVPVAPPREAGSG